MRISFIVSLVSSRKIPNIIDYIFKNQMFNGRGTYESKTWSESYSFFWAMTPSRARLALRQMPNRRLWLFEGRFPGLDPTPAKSIGLLLSYIDGMCRIVAMGEGHTWYFDHIHKVFKKSDPTIQPWPGVIEGKKKSRSGKPKASSHKKRR